MAKPHHTACSNRWANCYPNDYWWNVVYSRWCQWEPKEENLSRKLPMFQMTAEAVNFLAGSSAMGPLYWTFCSECIQAWIWNDGSPWILSPRHYSINKYSFSFSPSSSIFSSIMAEVTAVKALYPLMFISRWGGGSFPNYEITEDWVWIFCSMCFLILCWVCVYSQNKNLSHPHPSTLPLWVHG